MKKMFMLVLALAVAISFSGVPFAQAGAVKEDPTPDDIKLKAQQGPGSGPSVPKKSEKKP
ncbi:MAG: hypothetical protein WCI75_08125 [candidate division NC10 bacterium]